MDGRWFPTPHTVAEGERFVPNRLNLNNIRDREPSTVESRGPTLISESGLKTYILEG